jgi:hypothetical protein
VHVREEGNFHALPAGWNPWATYTSPSYLPQFFPSSPLSTPVEEPSTR